MSRARDFKTEWLWPLALTAAGLLLRALLADPTRVVWGDEPFYLWDGRNLALGRGYSFFNGIPDVYLTPLYPLLIAGLYLALRNLELASRLCYIVLGAALTLPIYGIARQMYGRRTAFIAAALVTVYPALTAAQLYWGTLTEPLFFLLLYAGLYVILRAANSEKAGVGPYALAGALFALTYLTRGEGITSIVAVGGVLALIRLCEGRLLERGVLLRLGVMVGAFIIVAFPYWLYLRVQTGQWAISGQAGMTYITCISLAYGDAAGFDRATWGLDQAGREVLFFSPDIATFSMFDHIRAYPGDFVRLVYQNLRDFIGTLFSGRMFPFYLIPFLALGLFDFAWERRRAKGELLLATAFAPALSFLFFFVQERYIGVALPLLLVWAAHGLERWGAWLTDTLSRLRRRGPVGPLWQAFLTGLPVALLLAVFVFSLPRIAAGTSVGSFRPAHRQAGLWLAQHGEPGVTVMSRYPAVAFHAGADWVPAPNADVEAVIAYGRAHGARYFVLDERETLKLRPQLAKLIDGPAPPGLRRLHELPDAGKKIVIFEVEAP